MPVKGEDILKTAQSYIGKVQYSFGADDIPNGKGDCSSFTKHVYREHGLEIGRDTNSQWQEGSEIPKSSLIPGDLVFFKNTYNSSHKDGVSHVGIYSGNGNFIHLGKKGVSESSLESEYWVEHWLGGRRLEGISGSAADPSPPISVNLEDKSLFENIAVAALIIIIMGSGLAFLSLAVGFSPKKLF